MTKTWTLLTSILITVIEKFRRPPRQPRTEIWMATTVKTTPTMRNSAVIMRSALGRPLESLDPNHELKAQTEANIIVASTQFGREKRAFGYLSKLRLFFQCGGLLWLQRTSVGGQNTSHSSLSLYIINEKEAEKWGHWLAAILFV